MGFVENTEGGLGLKSWGWLCLRVPVILALSRFSKDSVEADLAGVSKGGLRATRSAWVGWGEIGGRGIASPTASPNPAADLFSCVKPVDPAALAPVLERQDAAVALT